MGGDHNDIKILGAVIFKIQGNAVRFTGYSTHGAVFNGPAFEWFQEGIDIGMAAAFDGLPQDREPFKMILTNIKQYDCSAVWLRYKVIK